ncbi:Deoxycytidine monophosphate (dCMP) deaminase [Rhodotorula toruloides]
MCPSRGLANRRLFTLLPTLFLLAAPVLAAVSSSDLLTYLGGSATGQTLTTAAYTLTMAANASSVLISCAYKGKVSELGWMGFGTGSAMSDADILVLWPNSDGSWTISHRTAATTVMPTLVGTANKDSLTDSSGSVRVVASLSSKSQTDSPAVVTFVRPLQMPATYKGKGEYYQLKKAINQQVIYAYGTKNPGSSAQDATLTQHPLDGMGATYVDLSATFSATSAAIEAPLSPVKGGSSSGGSSAADGTSAAPTTAGAASGSSSGAAAASAATAGATSGGDSTTGAASLLPSTDPMTSSGSTTGAAGGGAWTYAAVIKMHGICAGATWAILAPLGVLFARYARGPPGTTLTRFPWHFYMQGLVVAPLTLVAVGLALWAVSLKGASDEAIYAHKAVGFAIAAGVVLQDLLGLWTHLSHAPARHGRPPPRALKAWLHMLLGVTLIVAGFVQVNLGLERYGITDGAIRWAYFGCLGVWVLAYFGSLAVSLARPASRPSAPPHHHRHRRRKRRPVVRKRRRKKKRRRRYDSSSSEDEYESDDSSSSGSSASSSGSSSRSSGRSRRR